MKVKKVNQKIPFLFLGVLLVLFMAGGIIKVVMGESTLPVITDVCEEKNGGLYAVNDGFSKYEECKKKGREVSLGTGNTTKNNGFLGEGGWYIDPNGQVWFYNCNSNNSWVKVAQTLPVDVSAITQWNGSLLMDNNQNIWKLDTTQAPSCDFTGSWSQIVSPQ